MRKEGTKKGSEKGMGGIGAEGGNLENRRVGFFLKIIKLIKFI